MTDIKLKKKTEQTPSGVIEYQATECHRCGYDTSISNSTFVWIADKYTEQSSIHGPDKYYIESSQDAQYPFCQNCAGAVFDEDVITDNYFQRGQEFIKLKERNETILIILLIYGFISSLFVTFLIIASLLGI